MGRASVRFQDVDLHAYIVGSDGRAYTAISGVPQPAARALLPLLPVGGFFAWLFALEEPGSENGFSITGKRGGGMCHRVPLLRGTRLLLGWHWEAMGGSGHPHGSSDHPAGFSWLSPPCCEALRVCFGEVFPKNPTTECRPLPFPAQAPNSPRAWR